MKNFNLLQIVPSLESGGVEQGTIDVANFLGEKNLGSFIVSNGGKMLTLLNNQKTKHIKLPVHSKNILAIPFIARKLNQTIKDNKINIVHVRSRAPAWFLQFIQDKKFKVIVDAVNSSASKILPLLLNKFNCEVICINCDSTGNFTRGAEPLPNNLSEISKT